ncbi:uncharacterized protein LOC110464162, partial [Mizuhopecten yessoensis]
THHEFKVAARNPAVTAVATVRRSSSLRNVSKRKKGSGTVRRTSSFSLLARPSKPGDRLTVETLQALSPFDVTGNDVVSGAARALLLNKVKMEKHVHDLFFPHETNDPLLDNFDTRGFPVDKLGTALVAQAISINKDDHKFHSMIDKRALADVLEELYNSLHWKKLGFCLYTLLYPDEVRNDVLGICLRDFIEDRGHVWAEKLLSHIMEPRWTAMWQYKIVRGQTSEEKYNREMNALFVKLHLLDPQSVIPAYQFLLNQRALPTVNLELATRNYLGDAIDCAEIEEEVLDAITRSSMPINVSRLSLSDIEIFYGVEVDEFIVTWCRNIGVWSGNRADNSRTSKPRDRCCVM